MASVLRNSERIKIGRMPFLLYLVEFILAYVLAANLYKFGNLTIGFNLSTAENMVKSLYLLLSTVISSELTIRTMVCLSSALKRSWQLASRTMLIQLLFISINECLLGSWSRIPLLESELFFAILCVTSLIILFLPHVRKYYTPPKVEVPPVKDWIPYIIYDNSKDKQYRYVLRYDR